MNVPTRIALVFLFAVIAVQAQGVPPLSAGQRAKLEAINTEMQKKMAPAAARFAEATVKIYDNMLSDRPDEQIRLQLAAEMNAAAGTLLTLKGEAIRDSVALLTAEQKAVVRAELRKPGAPSDLTEIISRVFKPLP